MPAHVEYTRNENDTRDGREKYTTFVMTDGNETQPPPHRTRRRRTRHIRHRLHPHRPPGPEPPAIRQHNLTTNKKANAHAQNYTPTVTAAHMPPIPEAHAGPVRRLPITGADHTASATNSPFEPITAHFTDDPDSPPYYTVKQVATIHNGLTPTIFATPPQRFGELAHSSTADTENTKQRDYWTTLAVTGMTLTRDGPTIQLSRQHPIRTENRKHDAESNQKPHPHR